MLISYEREAYTWADDPNFRVTFDSAARARQTDLLLENGSAGASLLPVGLDLMEVKSLGAMPLSFARSLNELSITPSSFSKYGTAYTRSLVTTATSTETILKGGLKYVSNL